jgi:glycosyltransferase involved in cell wall biosynthesis
MKILRVIASLNPATGGPSQGIRNSIPALASLGIENEVVCCDPPDAGWIGRDAFPLYALGPGRFGFSYTPRLGPWLRDNAQRFDAVVVHGMWQWPGICTVLALASGRKPKQFEDPPLATRHPPLFLMPHGMLDPWFQLDRSRRLKALRNFFYWWLAERRVVNGATGVLFTCEEEMRLARQTFGGYCPRREYDIGYGVPEPPVFSEKMRAAFSAKVPGLEGKPYLLFLGRIHPKKSVDLLVRAYSEILKTEKLKTGFPDLVIAGPCWDSEYGLKIRRMIEGQSSIHTVGMLEGDAKWGALHGCSALVLPSHQENFGIAVAEALACNKPVLISNKVNIWREVIEDGAGIAVEDDLPGTTQLLRAYADACGRGDSMRFRACYLKRFGIQLAAQKLASALRNSQS